VRDEDFVQAVDESEEVGLRDLVGGEGGWVGASEGAGEGGAEGFVSFWGLLGVVWWRADSWDLTWYHAWEGEGATWPCQWNWVGWMRVQGS
jgi:hypothetical protein